MVTAGCGARCGESTLNTTEDRSVRVHSSHPCGWERDHHRPGVLPPRGTFTYHYGAEEKRKPGESRSFFLPPYAELVTMWWSRGRRRGTQPRNLETEGGRSRVSHTWWCQDTLLVAPYAVVAVAYTSRC